MIDCTKTENYFAEKKRMTIATKLSAKWGICKLSCKECPLFITNNGIGDSCTNLEIHDSEKAIAIVQKWSDEHPQKTYLTELLEHFPNVALDEYGVPQGICPHQLGLVSNKDKCNGNCAKCWNYPIEESDLVESEKINIKSNKT